MKQKRNLTFSLAESERTREIRISTISTLSGCNEVCIWFIMFWKGEVHYES